MKIEDKDQIGPFEDDYFVRGIFMQELQVGGVKEAVCLGQCNHVAVEPGQQMILKMNIVYEMSLPSGMLK